MPFEIVRNDITNMQVDAIVNAANPRPVVGYGVDTGIHLKAGSKLLEARVKIGDIPFGDAAITPAFKLDAKYVIHAISPVWQNGKKNEIQLLEKCYKKSLQLALEHECESIAFPLLSAGNHGFPKDIALQTAIGVFSKFLMKHEMQIYLVVFNYDAFSLSEKLFHSVQSYIDENYIQDKFLTEYNIKHHPTTRDFQPDELYRYVYNRRIHSLAVAETQANTAYEDEEEFEDDIIMPSASTPSRSLEDLMKEVDETFSQHLIRMIDQKGLKDPDVYKKANVDRKLFSKIKNNIDYKPSKATAISFAIALELNLDETRNFIGRAGYALTHSSKFDIIIEYFLMNQNYDMFEINEVLFAFKQPTLCS